MRFRLLMTQNILPRELCSNILPHLKTTLPDMRSDICMNTGRNSTRAYHDIDGTVHDTAHGTAPSGMDRTTHSGLLVEKEYREAVGGIYSDSHAAHGGNDSIHPVNIPVGNGQRAYKSHVHTMCLPGYYEMVKRNAEIVGKRITTSLPVFFGVADIVAKRKSGITIISGRHTPKCCADTYSRRIV